MNRAKHNKGNIAGQLVVTLIAWLGLRAVTSWVRRSGGDIARLMESLGLIGEVSKFASTAAVTLLCVAIVVVYALARGVRPRELGFVGRHAVGYYLTGALVSLGMVGAVLGLTYAAGGVEFVASGWHGASLVEFGAVLLLGMLNIREEVMFRGWMLGEMRGYLPQVLAVALSSLLFSISHITNAHITPLALLNIFLGGTFWAFCYLRTGSIWLVAAMHTFWNFAQSRIIGLPMSGHPSSDALWNFQGVEQGLFATDAFGLEGNLASTVVFAVAIGVVLLLPKHKK